MVFKKNVCCRYDARFTSHPNARTCIPSACSSGSGSIDDTGISCPSVTLAQRADTRSCPFYIGLENHIFSYSLFSSFHFL